jgi:uncharacterized hydrophobic protein (TIGR00271 family)
MGLLKRLTSHTLRLREKTERRLETYTRPTKNFFILIALSTAIVVLGLMLNNTAIVIGGMVVAPLITPIFGFSLGLILLKARNLGASLFSIVLGTSLTIVVAALISYLIIVLEGQHFALTAEIMTRTKPDFLFFLVALFSGMAGAYAYTNEEVAERITGIAISVAIIPPLAVAGIGIAMLNFHLIGQGILLYLFNLAGICFGSVIMFMLMGFGKDIEAQSNK